ACVRHIAVRHSLRSPSWEWPMRHRVSFLSVHHARRLSTLALIVAGTAVASSHAPFSPGSGVFGVVSARPERGHFSTPLDRWTW
ncbi:MAG TPA: hypothetical protein VFV87_17745, partial [Pirellulaceae bacterium]|nr:hypothetical protein [Pirellulaceae bacterium]